MKLPRTWLWLALLLVPVVELLAHCGIRAGVAPLDDWQRAASLVREQHRAGDQITVAPEWAEPTLREVLGDVLTAADVGASDLARYERLWSLSIRGKRTPIAPEREPELEEVFGGVTVRRWDLGDSPVVYDFAAHWRDANVTWDGKGGRQCALRRAGGARGGGLGRGPVRPAERFVCDASRSNAWVGPTVSEDTELKLRHCIWQHSLGREPVRVRFEDVPLGERIVLYGAPYFRDERKEKGVPIHLRIEVDGQPVGRMVHRDGEGWKRMVAHTRPPRQATEQPDARGEVTFAVHSKNHRKRSFCWQATVRAGPERDEP